MMVVLLASTDEIPVPETLPVPVPVGPEVSEPSVLLAKGPLEVDDGSGPKPVPLSPLVPLVTRGTDEGQPVPRQVEDMLDNGAAVSALAGTTVTSEALTSKIEQASESQVTEIMSFLGLKEGRGAGAAVMLEISALHGEPYRLSALPEH